MIRWAAGRLDLRNIEPPTVRWPSPVAYTPEWADRAREWPIIEDLLAGRLRERILLIEGDSGFGKSALLRQTVVYARQLDIPSVQVDFKGSTMNIEDILGQFDLDLGPQLPNFSRETPGKTHMLRKDLRALRRPILLVFDSYEAVADNHIIANWLSQQILTEVETALGVCVLIAGQRVPNYANARWHDLALSVLLTPISEIEH